MTLTEGSLDVLDVEKFGQAYLAGSAFPERVAMTKESDGVYTWKGKLEVEDPVTGFYIVSNDNSQSLNPANASEVKSGSYAPVFSADEVATAEYQIASTATYTITIDLNTVKMEVTKIDYDHLYLIGSAMKGEPGAWKTEDGVEMTRVSEGVFTWNGFCMPRTPKEVIRNSNLSINLLPEIGKTVLYSIKHKREISSLR